MVIALLPSIIVYTIIIVLKHNYSFILLNYNNIDTPIYINLIFFEITTNT